MAWSDPVTEKQLSAIAQMVTNCRYPQFTVEERGAFYQMIKTRKDASEVMDELRAVRAKEENSRNAFAVGEPKEAATNKWYPMLLELARPRLESEQKVKLEKLIKEHPNSSCRELWEKELKTLKEEK